MDIFPKPKLEEKSVVLSHTYVLVCGWTCLVSICCLPHWNVSRSGVDALLSKCRFSPFTLSVRFSTHLPPCPPFSQALALPSEMSARIARNTQLILQEESRITQASGQGERYWQ